MTMLQQQTRDLMEKLENLKLARRKVLVLCGRPLGGKTALAKEVCQQLNATYVDASVELLPRITSPVLGAYGPDDFLRWIKGEASKSKILCVDEIDPLLTTFGKQGARDFFQILGSIEPKQAIIIIISPEKEVPMQTLSRINLWYNVQFTVEGLELQRRLVHNVTDHATELNADSPVGQALLSALPGDELTVTAPGGPVTVRVITIIP